jgi:hypothetical protein
LFHYTRKNSEVKCDGKETGWMESGPIENIQVSERHILQKHQLAYSLQVSKSNNLLKNNALSD